MMRFNKSLFAIPIFITIVAALFLSGSVINLIVKEKGTGRLHDEIRILTSQQEDIDKEIQTLSHELSSATQEIKDIRTERSYLKREIEHVRGQINWIHLRLDNILEAQHSFTSLIPPNDIPPLYEERIKAVGIGRPLLIPVETHPQHEKELLSVESSLEMQGISEHFQQAVLYQKHGELSKAVQEYEDVLIKDPLNAEAHNNLGLLHQQKGEHDKALLEYRKAVSLRPGYNKARSNMGAALYSLGRLEAAGLEFKRVLDEEPEDVHAMTNLAVIYRESGMPGEARDLLLRALDIDDKFPEAHYNLAQTLEELGGVDDAVVHYRAFLLYSHDADAPLQAGVLRHLEAIEKR